MTFKALQPLTPQLIALCSPQSFILALKHCSGSSGITPGPQSAPHSPLSCDHFSVFITPRAGQMQRSNYWDFVHKQTDQSEREKFTWLSKPKPNSLRTRLPGMPQHQPRQTHTLRSKEEKAACEKELSEIVLFLLQRNWLAWSWTSGKQPKINGENSVGINPGTAVLQTQPGVEAFHKSSSFEAFHSTRWALAAWPRPWREDKYSLTQLTPRIGNATPIIITEVLRPGLISCFVKL